MQLGIGVNTGNMVEQVSPDKPSNASNQYPHNNFSGAPVVLAGL
jgi:hypothetical protein